MDSHAYNQLSGYRSGGSRPRGSCSRSSIGTSLFFIKRRGAGKAVEVSGYDIGIGISRCKINGYLISPGMGGSRVPAV